MLATGYLVTELGKFVMVSPRNDLIELNRYGLGDNDRLQDYLTWPMKMVMPILNAGDKQGMPRLHLSVQ